jgi:hypothetical protein
MLTFASTPFQKKIEAFQYTTRTAGVHNVPFLSALICGARFGGLGGISDHRPRRSSGTWSAPRVGVPNLLDEMVTSIRTSVRLGSADGGPSIFSFF